MAKLASKDSRNVLQLEACDSEAGAVEGSLRCSTYYKAGTGDDRQRLRQVSTEHHCRH